MSTKGTVIGINGNMVSVKADGSVIMNEVGYIKNGDKSFHQLVKPREIYAPPCRIVTTMPFVSFISFLPLLFCNNQDIRHG